VRAILWALSALLWMCPSAKADAPVLRVCTYNVYDWRLSTPAIVALVEEIGPAVLLLQEANGLGESVFVDLPLTTIESGRAATVRGLWLASVHLSVGGGNHYAAMGAILEKFPGGPGLIGGDFNETPDEVDTYGRAWDLLAMHALAEAGWTRVDTPRQPASDLVGSWAGSDWTHGRGRLDQLWLSPGLLWADCGIPPAPWIREGAMPSDHAPVWVDVLVSEPAVVGLLGLGLLLLLRPRRLHAGASHDSRAA